MDSTAHPGLTTFHDSCSYGRKSLHRFGHGYFDEARTLVRTCCPEFTELLPEREQSYCCGAGGGAWAQPWDAERIFHGRIKARQVRRSGAQRLVVSCPTCRDQLYNLLHHEYSMDIEIKFLWQLIAEALVPAGTTNTDEE